MDTEKKKPAVFLDRDGVLSEEKSYVCSVEQLNIFPYTAECVRKIKEKGYYAIVITNQSGVARGLFTEDALRKMNQYMVEHTGVDAVYYCPHHKKGVVLGYALECNCRKPGTGLIEQARQDFNIDMGRSWFVGDRASDIQTGKKAGIKTILVESGYGTKRLEENVAPDYILEDLREVIQLL